VKVKDEVRVRPVVDCSRDVPRTKQSFREEVDINVIMRKYVKTGRLDPGQVVTRQGAFGDFTGIDDFLVCQNKVLEAKRAFDDLPPKVRSRFRNRPADLIGFLEDPENDEEAISLGLRAKPEVEPVTAPSTPEVAPAEPEVPKAEPPKAE